MTFSFDLLSPWLSSHSLAHPDRVKAIILIDSDAAVDPPEVLEGYGDMLAAATGDDDEAFEAVMEGVAGIIQSIAVLRWQRHCLAAAGS